MDRMYCRNMAIVQASAAAALLVSWFFGPWGEERSAWANRLLRWELAPGFFICALASAMLALQNWREYRRCGPKEKA
jgi:hypothetical protein